MEGIFPRSYVDVIQDKGVASPPPSGYGNMPLEVSQSGSVADPEGKNGKFEQHGKKFGKKLGNAGTYSPMWQMLTQMSTLMKHCCAHLSLVVWMHGY